MLADLEILTESAFTSAHKALGNQIFIPHVKLWVPPRYDRHVQCALTRNYSGFASRSPKSFFFSK